MVDERNKKIDYFSQSGNEVIKVKVVVIGDVSVGKTSLATRFTKDCFDEKTNHTIGASYYVRTVEIDEKKILFQIWDTAGQERFRSLVPMYLRDTKVAILLYDITSATSFRNVTFWMKELNASAPMDTTVVLVGNKSDLFDKREVETKDGKEFANRYSMVFTETSAKLGSNIEELFNTLAHTMLSEGVFESSVEKTMKPKESNIKIQTVRNNANFTQMSKRQCCRSGH